MCEYCNQDNKEEELRGSDGIVFDVKEGKYNLYVEHFRNEKHWIKVLYCPQCGRKLS